MLIPFPSPVFLPLLLSLRGGLSASEQTASLCLVRADGTQTEGSFLLNLDWISIRGGDSAFGESLENMGAVE